VGWGQGRPDECASDTTYPTPVSMINVDNTCKSALPFIEILGLQDRLTSNIAAKNFTSPCITGNSKKVGSPDFTFSTQPGLSFVGFSGDDDSIAPLEVSYQYKKRKRYINPDNRKQNGYCMWVHSLTWN
jgi:hypothetical protein